MDSKVQEFLQSQRVSVLGVLQSDNVVHSATLHFVHNEDPLSFFFMTEKQTRKCQSLLDGSEQNASLVIGFSEDEFATFQAEGKVVIVTGENLESGWDTYIQKYPDRSGGKNNPEMALLQFTPTWWRYLDMKTNPVTEVSSE